jgi:nicotinate phosphoribosyltransferase
MKTERPPANLGATSDFVETGQVTALSPASELVAYYGGPAADVYFQRARTTLAGAHVDALVAMDFFASKPGILCGVAEAVRLLGSVLADGDEAWAIAEGEPVASRETVLRVRAPYSRFGVYETALLGMLSSCTGWATAAREVVDAAGGKRVISFGARHVHPLIAPTMEYSAVVGGCAGCATPLGAQLAGLLGASGTMPHAMILLFGDTVKAARAFDEHMPDDVLRIVLVDTFKDEAEEALRVADALGKRLRGVRLDTPSERGGVTIDLVKEVRARLDLAGHGHVGIFISGGLDAARVREFEAAGSPIHSYGVGMAISSAPPIAFTADIKEIAGKPMTKRGRIPGAAPNPRLARVI